MIFKTQNITMYNQDSNYSIEPTKSRAKNIKETNSNFREDYEREDAEGLQELKQENIKLKKMIKQAQAKRIHITKECSQLNKHIEKLEQQNQELKHIVRDSEDKIDGQKYRWQQLKFLNKQLSSEIEELRNQNQSVSQKLRYSSQILQRKYEQLQQKTYKRMQQCVKRVKKTIHYLQNLSVKQIDKTREILIDNLRKGIQLLRGKYSEEFNCEGEIQEFMNPLKTMQEEINSKTKEMNNYKQENARLIEEISKYKAMEKDQIPMFKEAIQKLKKSLVQVRGQLSENQYEKLQIKKKYQQKLKEVEFKYNQVFKECRKIKLQKKIYQNKLQELEADVEQEKQRLIGQNQMLKKLYNNQDSSSSRISQLSSYKPSPHSKDKKTQQKKIVKKNYSSNELKTLNINLKNSISEYEIGGGRGGEVSQYNQQSSMLSQQNLKNEICRIDEQIMQIQKNLTKELQAFH